MVVEPAPSTRTRRAITARPTIAAKPGAKGSCSFVLRGVRDARRLKMTDDDADTLKTVHHSFPFTKVDDSPFLLV